MIEAMKQALEALKMCRGLIRNNIAEGVAISSPNPFFSADVDNAITTLRTAIAEAESRASEQAKSKTKEQFKTDRFVRQLDEAIEQAEKQEPVAWIDSDWHYQLHKKGMVVAHKNKSDVLIGNPQPFYTVPQPSPQTWVAITEEEFEQMLVDARFTKTDLMMIGACVDDIRQMIEAKLKEKNT
jgi:hypothetical protein